MDFRGKIIRFFHRKTPHFRHVFGVKLHLKRCKFLPENSRFWGHFNPFLSGHFRGSNHRRNCKVYNVFATLDNRIVCLGEFNLACCYSSASSTSYNFKESVRLLRLSVEKGYAPAQAGLGRAYRHGVEVKSDLDEAIKWFTLAVEQGDVSSQRTLGDLHYGSVFDKEGPEVAFKWLKMASDNGCSDSFFTVAHMYSVGYGVERSMEKAYEMFMLLAERAIPVPSSV